MKTLFVSMFAVAALAMGGWSLPVADASTTKSCATKACCCADSCSCVNCTCANCSCSGCAKD